MPRADPVEHETRVERQAALAPRRLARIKLRVRQRAAAVRQPIADDLAAQVKAERLDLDEQFAVGDARAQVLEQVVLVL